MTLESVVPLDSKSNVVDDQQSFLTPHDDKIPRLSSTPPQQNDSPFAWRLTDVAEMLAKRDKTRMYEEKGFLSAEKTYNGRNVISRDKAINGGVYLCSGGKESIIVDNKVDPKLAEQFGKLLGWLAYEVTQLGNGDGDIRHYALAGVLDYVQSVMPYSMEKVEELQSKMTKPTDEIMLSSFLEGGICRHQALLAAYLIEQLINRGYLSGKVSIDRNHTNDQGSHAWVRYTNSAGRVYVIDPATNTIDDIAVASRRLDWPYQRPEDLHFFPRLLAKVKNIFSPFLP